MKKAIVFGATGQLGCYSALALKDSGYDVIAVGRRLSDGGFFATRDIKFIGGFDIAREDVFDILPNQKYDVVVNMAGTMPAHADMKMMPYVQSIVVGTVNLCNWMKQNGSKRIVFNTTPSDVVEHWGSTVPIDDDAIRSIKLIASKLADAVLEGKQLRENKANESKKIEKITAADAGVSEADAQKAE